MDKESFYKSVLDRLKSIDFDRRLYSFYESHCHKESMELRDTSVVGDLIVGLGFRPKLFKREDLFVFKRETDFGRIGFEVHVFGKCQIELNLI